MEQHNTGTIIGNIMAWTCLFISATTAIAALQVLALLFSIGASYYTIKKNKK